MNILQGDSLQLLKTFKDKEFDYFLTSPPFKEEEFGGDDYWNNMDAIIGELRRITSKAGFMFQSSTKQIQMIRRYEDIIRVLIWAKQPSNTAYRYEPIFVWQFGDFKINRYLFKDVWVIPAVLHSNFDPAPMRKKWTNAGHPSYENPLRLYKQLLQMLPKGKVIDPFLGTGTTTNACRMLGHECVGIEIDPAKPCFRKGLEVFG